MENVVRCLCNVHALRKFKDAYKLLPNNKERKTSDEAKAIEKYDEIIHQSNLIDKAGVEKIQQSRKTNGIYHKTSKTRAQAKI